MRLTYEFLQEQGAVLYSDYGAYTAREALCEHQSADVTAKVTNWGQVTGTIDDMKSRVAMQPVTVAINASSEAFQYYDSGVVTADQCSTSLNHAVVVVGYRAVSDSDTDPSPGPGPDPEPTPEPVECKVTKWWHTCEQQANSRMLQDGGDGYNNFWVIQNSWGTNQGDSGFIRFDMVEGYGVCGINNVVEWADVAYV